MTVAPGTQANINVTPMIDILLVLLIIFLVVAPVTPYGLNAALPRQDPQQPSPAPPVFIAVDRDGTVRLNREPVRRADLGGRLADVFRSRPETVAFVSGNASLDFRAIASVIDIAKGAGAARVGLLTGPSERK